MEPTVTSEAMTFDAQAPRLTVDVGPGDVTVGRTDGELVSSTTGPCR